MLESKKYDDCPAMDSSHVLFLAVMDGSQINLPLISNIFTCGSESQILNHESWTEYPKQISKLKA